MAASRSEQGWKGRREPAPSGVDALLGRLMRSEAAEILRVNGMRAARLTYRTPQPLLLHRHDLPTLLNRRGLLGCGVEVGVKKGEFSEVLLSKWWGRHLISVDPWRSAPADEYVDLANVEQDEHDRYHAETRARLSRFGERSSVWRMTGEEATARVPHHCLDFVYLDARHDHDSLSEDLLHWYEKVRPGGLLAGHDYIDGHFPTGDFGVQSAVDEFFGARGLPVHATRADAPWRTWFVSVPRGT